LGTLALSPDSGLSARVPTCQKIEKGGLDQYGPEYFEMQPFDSTWLERVNIVYHVSSWWFIEEY